MRWLDTRRIEDSRATRGDEDASTLGNGLSSAVESNGQRARKHVKHAVRPAIGHTLHRRQADSEQPEMEWRVDNAAEMNRRQQRTHRIFGLRFGGRRQRPRREGEAEPLAPSDYRYQILRGFRADDTP